MTSVVEAPSATLDWTAMFCPELHWADAHTTEAEPAPVPFACSRCDEDLPERDPADPTAVRAYLLTEGAGDVLVVLCAGCYLGGG